MKKPYVIYTLSKDRTTQKFNKSKFHDIIKDIDCFLQSCTTTNINEPTEIKLTAYSAFDETDPAETLLEIINKTYERFGASKESPLGYHYPSGIPHTTRVHSWTLSKDQLQDAIQYITDNSPMPKSNFGPIELFISYNFELVNRESKEKLSNQENSSHLLIWLSRGKSCSPILFFPFEEANGIFWEYIDSLIPLLPFKLEERYLRISHINKQGEIKSFKKITRP